MIWTAAAKYDELPFATEREFEGAVAKLKSDLFGSKRVYLETKQLIGKKGVRQNIPDAYLVDLSSARAPKLFVVETELARHEHLKHIAVQLLEFSLAFELDPLRVKQVLREAIKDSPADEARIGEFAARHGFDNIDYFLEQLVHKKEAFNALLIIDEQTEYLQNVLRTRFQFPVEILTIERFGGSGGEHIFKFEPFLSEVDESDEGSVLPSLDPAELDTVVVPAVDEGFEETAIGENRWHHIRMSAAMIPQIRYLATYRVAPISAITHWAPVAKIQLWNDTAKYELVFAEPLKEFSKPIKLVPQSRVKALQAPRYASLERLKRAENLDSAF